MRALYDLAMLPKGSGSQILSEIDKNRPKLGLLKHHTCQICQKIEKNSILRANVENYSALFWVNLI